MYRLQQSEPTREILNLVLWYIKERIELEGLDLERNFQLPPAENIYQPSSVPR